MRVTILAVGLAALVGVSSIGCKSMPQLAWWKKASLADSGSTAVVRTAPALPSEIAKQAEGLTAPTSVQVAGGEATPFLPGAIKATGASATTPMAYPSTGVGSFSTAPKSTATVAAAATTANLGSIGLPYNPNVLPAAKTAVTAPLVSPASNSGRYASTSTPTNFPSSNGMSATGSASPYANQLATTQTPRTGAGSQMQPYPVTAATSTTRQPSYSPLAANTGTPTANPSSVLGDRYSQTSATATSVAPVSASSLGSNSVATAVATTPVYRPGGTSSYPGTIGQQPAIEVASRPNVATSTEAAHEHTHAHEHEHEHEQVPNVTTPGESNLMAPYVSPLPSSYR